MSGLTVGGLLERLLGRLPIGWLQLVHNRTRLAAALAGVAFANVLIFMQLGFLGALVESIRLPYAAMNADVIVSASDMNTLADASPLPRSRMVEALSVPGVVAATPLYHGRIDWKQPDGTIRTLDVFGIDPAAEAFRTPAIAAARGAIAASDVAIVDRRTRNVPRDVFAAIERGEPYRFEARGRTLTVVGTFTIGGGFSADGYLVVSDQTFLRLFPQRASGAPNLVLLRLEREADRETVVARLRATLPAYDSAVRTVEETVARDQAFQTTQRPIGIVFGFGIVIGVLVGVVIVYQVLSTDVADHLEEYATLKAIGYPRRFFLGIVFEEALILALLGFVPGILVALALYAAISAATGLPLAMTPARPLWVLLGTLAMCALSGAVATRRLARADPADLF
jgi:putative ABC transport system permease protein